MGFATLVVLIVSQNEINRLTFVIQTDSARFDARTEIFVIRGLSGNNAAILNISRTGRVPLM